MNVNCDQKRFPLYVTIYSSTYLYFFLFTYESQNYENSSASLRGQQLLQKVRARKEGQDNGMGRDAERESRGGGLRNSKKIFTGQKKKVQQINILRCAVF